MFSLHHVAHHVFSLRDRWPSRCRPRARILNAERLEDRVLLAATVAKNGTTLTITGAVGNVAEHVILTGGAVGTVNVSGDASPGGPYLGVENIIIKTNGGNDWFEFGTLDVANGIHISGGVSVTDKGLDASVTFNRGSGNSIGGSLVTKGADAVSISSTTIGQNVTIQGSAVGDAVSIRNGSQVHGDVTVKLGDGDNTFFIWENASVDGNVSYAGGKQIPGLVYYTDICGIQTGARIGGSVTAKMGDGDNTLIVYKNVEITGGIVYQGGKHADTVALLSDQVPIGDDVHIGGGITTKLGDGFNTFDVTDEVSIGGSLTCEGGDSTDRFTFRDAEVTGLVSLKTGAGGDRIRTLAGTTFSAFVTADTGAGVDTVELTSSTFLRNAIFSTGDTQDTVTINTSIFQQNAIFNTGDAQDAVTINTSIFQQNAIFNTGDAQDAVTINTSLFQQNATVDLGAANDAVTLGGTTVGTVLTLNGRDGIDRLNNNGGNTIQSLVTLSFEEIVP